MGKKKVRKTRLPRLRFKLKQTNMNEFALEVKRLEGGKTKISIAQIMEVLRIVLRLLAAMPIYQRWAILLRYSRLNRKERRRK